MFSYLRDGNGFWYPYTVGYVYAKFKCGLHGEERYVWSSREVQVDIKVENRNCMKGETLSDDFSFATTLLKSEVK